MSIIVIFTFSGVKPIIGFNLLTFKHCILLSQSVYILFLHIVNLSGGTKLVRNFLNGLNHANILLSFIITKTSDLIKNYDYYLNGSIPDNIFKVRVFLSYRGPTNTTHTEPVIYITSFFKSHLETEHI